MLLERSRHLRRLEDLPHTPPVCWATRRSSGGKTTLARQLVARSSGPTTIFDLESPADLARLDDPFTGTARTGRPVVLDEVQRRPELFPGSAYSLIVHRIQWFLRRSASPTLLRQSSESLAGRIYYHELGGFALDEVGKKPETSSGYAVDFPRHSSPSRTR